MKNSEFKLLGKFSDKDFFPEYNGEIYSNVARQCVKVIIVDDQNNIALVKVKYFLIPGGGVEAGESLIDAAKRESLEEAGCNIQELFPIGKTIESRASRQGVQETFCFSSKILGEKGKPTSIQEDEMGIEVFWQGIDEAIEIMKERQKNIHKDSYHTHFNVATHILFLEEFKNQKFK